jgi:hypothetical protein
MPSRQRCPTGELMKRAMDLVYRDRDKKKLERIKESATLNDII